MPGHETRTIAGRDPDGVPRVVEVTAEGAIEVSASAADRPDNPIVHNVTLTLADTEYSQVLPLDCKAFEFHCRSSDAIRFAFEPGRVAAPAAPYMTLPADNWYYSFDIDFDVVWTVYFASAVAAVVVEIIAWS